MDGRQYVDGVALEQTAFARDPKNPIVTGYVMERMAGLEQTRFQVFDAADNGELDEVVRRIGIAEPVVWVGSPGWRRRCRVRCPPGITRRPLNHR